MKISTHKEINKFKKDWTIPNCAEEAFKSLPLIKIVQQLNAFNSTYVHLIRNPLNLKAKEYFTLTQDLDSLFHKCKMLS